ncbi:MAG: 50S ribosomal protein L24 [Myxococcales bacterium]|nr:50S ribosomal protein L24 [Myxococcales bacterium]
MPARIRKGDTVVVIAGKDKGKTGEVLRFEGDDRVVVQRINMQKRHKRPTQQNQSGGIVEQEGTIHVSNVMLADPKEPTKGTRVGFRKDGDKLVRVAKRSSTDVPAA